MWWMTILYFICNCGSNLTTYYLSWRSHLTSVTCFGNTLKRRYEGVALWLLTMVIMTILDYIGEAIRGFTPCYLSPWTQLKGVTSLGTSLKGRDGRVSVWLLTTWVTMNLDYICEASAGYTRYHLLWITKLKSVDVFKSSFFWNGRKILLLDHLLLGRF